MSPQCETMRGFVAFRAFLLWPRGRSLHLGFTRTALARKLGGFEDRVLASRLMLMMLRPRSAGPTTADMFYHSLRQLSKVPNKDIVLKIGRRRVARRRLQNQILGRTMTPGSVKGVLRLRLRHRIRVGLAVTAILGRIGKLRGPTHGAPTTAIGNNITLREVVAVAVAEDIGLKDVVLAKDTKEMVEAGPHGTRTMDMEAVTLGSGDNKDPAGVITLGIHQEIVVTEEVLEALAAGTTSAVSGQAVVAVVLRRIQHSRESSEL